MTEKTIKYYINYIKNHHSECPLDCIEKAYALYINCLKTEENFDKKFLTYMKELGLTDTELYYGMAANVLKPWFNKADLYYDRNFYYNNIRGISIERENKIGYFQVEVRIGLKEGMPETVEEYIDQQIALREKSLQVVEVKEDDEEFVNPFILDC